MIWRKMTQSKIGWSGSVKGFLCKTGKKLWSKIMVELFSEVDSISERNPPGIYKMVVHFYPALP